MNVINEKLISRFDCLFENPDVLSFSINTPHRGFEDVIEVVLNFRDHTQKRAVVSRYELVRSSSSEKSITEFFKKHCLF